jgi:hypothetical protein
LDRLELEPGENIELADELELTVASIELADEEVAVTTVLLELTDILDELVTAVLEEAASRDELDVSSSFSPPQPTRATPNVNIVNTLESILVTSIIFVSRKGVKLLLPSKSLLTSSVTNTPGRLVSIQTTIPKAV